MTKLFIKDGIIKPKHLIVVIENDYQIINPTEEQVLADGWVEYVKPEPQPILEPDENMVQHTVFRMMLPQAKQTFEELPDKEALEVKELADTWYSKIGQTVPKDKRLYYDDMLYKVLKEHLVQEHFPPSIDTGSLYAVISSETMEHEGTLEDPIPYVQNMLLEEGKYYIQYDVIYKCIMTIPTGYPFDLKDMPTIVTEIK